MKISKENLIELDKLGVTQIKNVLSLDQCNEIIKQFDIEKAKFANLHVDELTCENRIWRAEHISKSVENVLSSDIVKHLSKKFNQKSEFAIVNHVWSGKGFGSGGGWHRDTRFGPQYKIIIYLTNCNQGNGEYWYIPKSHKIYSFFSFLKVSVLVFLILVKVSLFLSQTVSFCLLKFVLLAVHVRQFQYPTLWLERF